jgi:hypothetical protein
MHRGASVLAFQELAVPMSHAERGRLGGLKRAYSQTAEQRHEQARKLYLAGAVKAVVDRAPELTDDQRAKIRAILLPALPAAEADMPADDNDGPGTRPGRRSTVPPPRATKGRGDGTP